MINAEAHYENHPDHPPLGSRWIHVPENDEPIRPNAVVYEVVAMVLTYNEAYDWRWSVNYRNIDLSLPTVYSRPLENFRKMKMRVED